MTLRPTPARASQVHDGKDGQGSPWQSDPGPSDPFYWTDEDGATHWRNLPLDPDPLRPDDVLITWGPSPRAVAYYRGRDDEREQRPSVLWAFLAGAVAGGIIGLILAVAVGRWVTG